MTLNKSDSIIIVSFKGSEDTVFDSNNISKFEALINNAADYIWANPETGFKEEKTTEFLANEFEKLGYELTYPDGITGFFTYADTGRKGPTVLVFAELDSVICKSHPNADKSTGAVHACGHFMQCAALLGLAAALKEPDALDGLCGKIKLCLVPAEECLEIDFRKNLIKSGKIKYFSGKQEFISRGYLDDADLCFMVHTREDGSKNKTDFILDVAHNGFITKIITFKGKASHAAEPEAGINALDMANTALSSINALRTTFRDSDMVRVHPIITEGGTIVNAVPEKVVIESYVRANNVAAMNDVNERVNRAVASAAAAFGGNVHIEDLPGYEPLVDDQKLNELAFDTAEKVFGKGSVRYADGGGAGSTDLGDVSMLIPAIHIFTNSAVGHAHGDDYFVENKYLAGVKSARMQYELIKELLSGGGEKAKEIVKNYKPQFKSKADYLKYKSSIFKDKDTVTYKSGKVIIDI